MTTPNTDDEFQCVSVDDFGCSNVAQLAVTIADALGGGVQLAVSQNTPTLLSLVLFQLR